MDNMSIEELIELREKVMKLNDDNELLTEINSLISEKQSKSEKMNYLVSNNRFLPPTIDKLDKEVILRNVLNYYKKDYNSDDEDRFQRFLNNSNGEGEDLIIVTGELYKEEPKLYRNVEIHYCYFLDIKHGGYSYSDRNDSNWIKKDDDIINIISDVPYLKSYFGYCDNLETLILLDNTKKVGDDSFDVCHNLKNVFFFPGIQYIGSYAFAYTDIERIILPDTVLEVGDRCFKQNTTIYMSHNTHISDIGYDIKFYDYKKPKSFFKKIFR